MRLLARSIAVLSLGAVGVAGLAAPAHALPISPHTYADIICGNPITPGPVGHPTVTTRAWGTLYPANAVILVEETVTHDSVPLVTAHSKLQTGPDGTWSLTKIDSAVPSGLYEYHVTVTDDSGKTTFGTAYDACKF